MTASGGWGDVPIEGGARRVVCSNHEILFGKNLLPRWASSGGFILLGSCVSDGGYGYGYQGGGGHRSVMYTSLPPNYSGQSYYYNKRYYAGGRYETGRYSHNGRSYGNRYYHNGQYIYGGAYRKYPSAASAPTPRPRSYGATYTAPRQYQQGPSSHQYQRGTSSRYQPRGTSSRYQSRSRY